MKVVWIGIIFGWVALQIPFILMLVKFKPLASRYPFSVKMKLLLPFSQSWKPAIRPDDLSEMTRYRRVFLGYYWGLFVLPLVLFYAALYFFG